MESGEGILTRMLLQGAMEANGESLPLCERCNMCSKGTVRVIESVSRSLDLFFLLFISVYRYGTNGLEVVKVVKHSCRLRETYFYVLWAIEARENNSAFKKL
jgi:hypothetical protein